MINVTANLILYTRSLMEDYRWAYKDRRVMDADIRNLESDYQNFEENKEKYLSKKFLFIRRLLNGFAFYRFFDTHKQDSSSRQIYALSGLTFFEEDAIKIHDLLSLTVSYLFFELHCYSGEVSDFKRNLSMPSAFPIEQLKSEFSSKLMNIRKYIDDFLIDTIDICDFVLSAQDSLILIKPLQRLVVNQELTSGTNGAPKRFSVFKRKT